MSAVAQTQQTTPPTPQQLQRVEVTGSNIKRVDAESVAPVQVITREDIQRTGQPTVADVLRNLPSNTGSFGENFTNSFAPGAAGISLRGLGQKTTLVLINGRRTAGYGFAQNLQDSFVDLNSIPTSAVERVEILKDGASAIYGSDAIAGVVNIILRRDFKGLEASVNYGTTAKSKNDYGATISGGFGDLGSNKFNVFGVFDYYHRDLIMMSDTDFGASRDYRSYQGGRNFTSLTGGGTWRQVAVNPVTGATALSNNFIASTSCRGQTINGTQALERGLTTSAAVGAAANTFCAQDFNNEFTSSPKTDRYGFLGRAVYEVSPTFTAFAEIGLSRVNSYQKFQDPFFAATTGLLVTPTGLQPFPYNVTFNSGIAGNPFPTTAQYSGVLGDFGTRDLDIQSDTGRALIGAQYSFGSWDLDSAVGYSRNKVNSDNLNRLSKSGVSAVFNVPSGQQPPTPVSSASTYNLDDFRLNSDAVRDQMRINFPRIATSTLAFVDTKASTELASVRLPGGPLGLAVGAEYRRETLKDRPDARALDGDILGQGLTATDGKRNSYAVYTELRLPVLSTLEAQAALRYDHYSDYGTSTTPKVGLKWTPTSALALRANWGKGFRAPTLPEISPSSATFFTSVEDPEDGVVRTISGVANSNPNLDAEKSKSLNLGLVFEPMRGLSASVDFYRIDWKNVVVIPSLQNILDASCPAGGPGCPSTPQVSRDPSTNAVYLVSTQYTNLANVHTRGLDFDIRYSVPTQSLGKFNLGVDANYIISYKEDQTECVGTNGCTNTIPRMKYGATLGWDYAALKTTARVNYIKGWTQSLLPGSYFTSQSPNFQNGVYPDKTPSYATLDLFGSYQITKNFQVALSVLNVFDKKPPYDPGFSSTFLYDFSQFDARGRSIRAALTYSMN